MPNGGQNYNRIIAEMYFSIFCWEMQDFFSKKCLKIQRGRAYLLMDMAMRR